MEFTRRKVLKLAAGVALAAFGERFSQYDTRTRAGGPRDHRSGVGRHWVMYAKSAVVGEFVTEVSAGHRQAKSMDGLPLEASLHVMMQ